MGESIKIFSYNILKDGTLTVTGTPDTGYPEARLCDWSQNLYWLDTVTEAKEFHIDQGAANIQDVTLLWIKDHNFDGENITWEWSDNDADWTAAVTGWTQSGNDPIIKTCSALTHRYWRVTVTSMTNPTCAEIIISEGFSFNIQAMPHPLHGYQDNVNWYKSIGGQERSVKLGTRKRIRRYSLRLSTSDKTNFLSMIDDLDELSTPFLLKDKDGDYFLARFRTLPDLSHLHSRTHIVVDIIEMV